MAATTISSRAFNQDTGRAKKAAEKGPVFITDRGTPAHVLLSIEEYRRLTGSGKSIIELLAMPDTEALDELDRELEGRKKTVMSKKRMDAVLEGLAGFGE